MVWEPFNGRSPEAQMEGSGGFPFSSVFISASVELSPLPSDVSKAEGSGSSKVCADHSGRLKVSPAKSSASADVVLTYTRT